MVQKHFCWLSFLLAVSLAGCSSTSNSGKYFDRDGPPSSLSAWRAGSSGAMKIRVEPAHKFANRPYRVMGQSFTPMTGDKSFTQTGTASWYGKQFHGKKTAIGEIYDMYAMTAAHPTMELPSYAKVTNLANGRSVIVRVNDRGPFIGGRAIDMSYAAAVKLGYQKKGTTKVRIERITRRQIARGDIPSATHTDVTLAAALASDTKTASKTASKTSSLLASAGTVSTPRHANVVKETHQSETMLKTLPSAEKTTASASSAQTASTTENASTVRIMAPLPSAVPNADDNARRTEDAIASYLPQEAVTTTSTAPDGTVSDPLADLMPSEAKADVSAATEDDAFDSVFPEAGSVENASTAAANNASELKLLDSCQAAWGAQIGAFDNKTNAQEFAAHTEMMLTTEGIAEPVRIAPAGDRWCVMVGSTTQAKAREIARTISDRLGTTAFAAFK